MNINSIRVLAFLDFHQPHVVAIQETKIDSSIATSELFPETCPYNVYRNLHGDSVILFVHKTISHMPITELESNSVSLGLKCLQTKLLIMWQVGIGNLVVPVKTFNCSEISLSIIISNQHKGKKLLSVHVLGDFNFKDIDWPDRLN